MCRAARLVNTPTSLWLQNGMKYFFGSTFIIFELNDFWQEINVFSFVLHFPIFKLCTTFAFAAKIGRNQFGSIFQEMFLRFHWQFDKYLVKMKGFWK